MRYLVDANGAVLGRLSSGVAKLLLKGNEVLVINAEKARMTGHLDDMLAKYKQRIEFKDKANPEHSPYYSRRPDLFVKRIIRGMLPYKRPKGKLAYKKLRVYMGAGKDIKGSEAYDMKAKRASDAYESSFTIKELTEKLGYR
jgi:large subunit ribosomal protein L13